MAEQSSYRYYNLEAVRKLLLAAFRAEELRRLCQNRPAFRPILDNFGPKYNLNDMVDEVIFYCEVHALLDQLLADVQSANPNQYERFRSQLPAVRPEGHNVAALRRGQKLLNGKYHILQLIAQGGTGFVYLAHDVLLNEQVAIKELVPALVSDEEGFRRFLVEARASRRLDHPHMVKTRDVFQEDRNYYMVMEYLPGGSLEERLQERKRLTVEESVQIAEQVCSGLTYAHEHGVVHCDLKPANILFAGDGTAKITDFGAAHVSSVTVTRSWRSTVGFVAGTLPYMSPEQTEGVRDDPRVDIYALGAILYRMLTKRTYLEFDDREVPRAQAANVERICSQQPDPPSAHNRHIPAWLDKVVLKALAKEPQDRYQGADALKAALMQQGQSRDPDDPFSLTGDIIDSVQPQQSASVLARQIATHKSRFWSFAAIIVLVSVVVTSAVIVYDLRTGPSKQTDVPTQTQAVVSTVSATLPIVAPSRSASVLPPTHTPTQTHTPVPMPTRSAAPTAMSTITSTPTTTPTMTPTPTVTAKPANTKSPATATFTPRPISDEWYWKDFGPFSAEDGALAVTNYANQMLAVSVLDLESGLVRGAHIDAESGSVWVVDVPPGAYRLQVRAGNLEATFQGGPFRYFHSGWRTCPESSVVVQRSRVLVFAVQIIEQSLPWEPEQYHLALAACPWMEDGELQ